MPTTGYPAELNHGGDGEDSVTVEYKGVRITITERSFEMNQEKGTRSGTMLVFVDTEFESSTTLSVNLNEDRLWEGDISA
jgi:hypothetical protein